MIAHRWMIVAAVSAVTLGCAGPLSRVVRAQDAVIPDAQQDIENPKYQLSGSVSANDVLVRSGPSENTNPIMKLQKGDRIVLIGVKGKWLKIVPPPGCFACIAKLYVDRNGDGRTGVVTTDSVVHPASELNQEVPPIAMGHISHGDHVDIVGEQDQYFRIRPPANASVWISKEYVTDVQVLGGQNQGHGNQQLASNSQTRPSDDGSIVQGSTTPDSGTLVDNATTEPSTRPADASAQVNPTPTTQPTALADMEAQFMAASKRPLGEQPIATLLAGYRTLAKDTSLTPTQQSGVASRIKLLQIRGEAQADILAMQKANADAAKRVQADQAEQAEIEARIKANQLTVYTALGTLRPSSVQTGGGTLYRLTDPATGRTVAYLRGDDSKFTGLLGQLIGVKGDIAADSQLSMKVISPTTVDAIDAAKVNTTITAQIMPPSLVAQPAQASAVEHSEP